MIKRMTRYYPVIDLIDPVFPNDPPLPKFPSAVYHVRRPCLDSYVFEPGPRLWGNL